VQQAIERDATTIKFGFQQVTLNIVGQKCDLLSKNPAKVRVLKNGLGIVTNARSAIVPNTPLVKI